jgi:hypothetical protein
MYHKKQKYHLLQFQKLEKRPLNAKLDNTLFQKSMNI